jgi:hypothetical protein
MKRVIPSSPFRPAYTWRVVSFHHIHDAIYRSPGLTKLGPTSQNAPYANFVELRKCEVRILGILRSSRQGSVDGIITST